MDTRDAIRTEFMRIYERERVDRITVKALCAAVPVARTTFYSHYRNVDDVLLEVEDGLLAGLAEVTERVSGGDLPHMCACRPTFSATGPSSSSTSQGTPTACSLSR